MFRLSRTIALALTLFLGYVCPLSLVQAQSLDDVLAEQGSPKTTVTTQCEPAAVVDEIVNLPFDINELPGQILRQYDSRVIAASLIERKRRFQDRWLSTADRLRLKLVPFPSMDSVEVLSMLPEKYLESFLKAGMLNAHQVKHSNGVMNLSWRADIEDIMAGIHLEWKYDPATNSVANYVRPKYGFIHFIKPCGVHTIPNRLLRYGQIIVVYRDPVKSRTTYSYGDSIDQIYNKAPQAKPRSEVRTLSLLMPPNEMEKKAVYVEAQIWGALSFADIKEFRIPKRRVDLVARLQVTGIPVCTYDREKLEELDYPVEESSLPLGGGEMLSQGDQSRRQTYIAEHCPKSTVLSVSAKGKKPPPLF